MGENFKIHLQGTADTKQWAAANGLLGKLEGSANKFVESIRAGVGIDLGGKLVNSLASLPGMFADIVKGGLDYNRVMQGAEIGITNLLGKFKQLDKEGAQSAAADAMKAMAAEEPRAAATMKQLLEGFQATIAPSHALGFSVEENIKLVADFSNVLNNLRVDSSQLNQELNSILTGNIGQDSVVAKRLEITKEEIDNAREAGTVLEYLKGKFAGMEQAGDGADVAFSSLQSTVEKLQGVLAKPLFDRIVQGSKDLMVVLDRPDVVKSLTELGVVIGDLAGRGLQLGQWASANAEGVKEMVYWVKEGFVSIFQLRGALAALGIVSSKLTPLPPATSTTGPAEAVPGTTGAAPMVSAPNAGGGGSGSSGGGGASQGKDRRTLQQQLEDLRREFITAKSDEKAKEIGYQIDDLQKEIDKQATDAQAESRDIAAKTAKANAEVQADEQRLELAREAEKTEVAITAARAAGQDIAAQQLEDQARINELVRKYRDELKMSADDALSLAQTKVQSERSIADQNSAQTGGGSGTDLDRLIERAKESAKRKKDRYKYSLANPDQDVSSIDQIKNNTIFQGEFYNNRGGGEATATRPDRGLDVNRVNSLGNPNSSGNILDGLRKKDTGSPLTDQSPLTPGGGLANFKGAEKGVQSPGSGNSGTVNLGPNKAAQTAKEAADGMGRLVTAVTQRDAALAGELSRLKSQVATLETRIADNARQIASNRS